MQLVDSHCHLDQLDLAAYAGDLHKIMQHADEKSVKHFLCVCITLEHFPQVLSVAEQFANVSASVGLHPNESITTPEPTADELVSLAQHPKVIAIGETGLDYFRSEGNLDWQRERFRQHISAAKTVKKPLIIHTRQAKEDTLKMMQEERVAEIGGVMHCFTEDWEAAQTAMDMGFYISFSGIVTFSSATIIQDVAKRIPLDRMLIETDSPYLAPVPFRGKSNEPAYVYYVAEYIAKLRGISIEEVAEATTKNFCKLFNCSL